MVVGFKLLQTLNKVINTKVGGYATLIRYEVFPPPPCDVKSGFNMIMEAANTIIYLVNTVLNFSVASYNVKLTDNNYYCLYPIIYHRHFQVARGRLYYNIL